MKIYTKTGDDGTTGLFGGARVRKDDLRVRAYGAVDELNSVVGLARLAPVGDDVDGLLARIQSELFDLGAELATVPKRAEKLDLPTLDERAVRHMEDAIDRFETELPKLTSFVLPGGTPAAAHLHHARTVCRRAERELVALAAVDAVRDVPLHYLNRLSDLLFTLARLGNARAGVADVPWKGRDR